MTTFFKTVGEIERKLFENQQDEAFIENEKVAYEKRIANAKERIQGRKNRIQKLQDHEFFVNVSDVMTECALEWGCLVSDLKVDLYIDRYFNPNMSDSIVLSSTSPLNFLVLSINHNNNILKIWPHISKQDIQNDGKTFQEHFHIISKWDHKMVAVKNVEDIIFRYPISKMINIKDGKIVIRSESDKLISRAIQRKEEREAILAEEKSEQELALKAKLKNNSLLRLCPDCGGIIAWCSHFKAFQHSVFTECAYMESKKGDRIWDNKMREENLKQMEENEKEC
ncbi:MAG: hypothetical protein E7379_04605 [Clostridiales bacterium]|nr:hypothetical protein [Clostridiales bacterium]